MGYYHSPYSIPHRGRSLLHTISTHWIDFLQFNKNIPPPPTVPTARYWTTSRLKSGSPCNVRGLLLVHAWNLLNVAHQMTRSVWPAFCSRLALIADPTTCTMWQSAIWPERPGHRQLATYHSFLRQIWTSIIKSRLLMLASICVSFTSFILFSPNLWGHSTRAYVWCTIIIFFYNSLPRGLVGEIRSDLTARTTSYQDTRLQPLSISLSFGNLTRSATMFSQQRAL